MGNNTSPSLQSPLDNSSSPSCKYSIIPLGIPVTSFKAKVCCFQHTGHVSERQGSYVYNCCCSCRWSETSSLNYGQRAYCSHPRCYISIESHGGMILTGENRRTRRKTCHSATLHNSNPTNPGANVDFRGERPATNRMSHVTHHFFSF
jgi:hypothetical protein